MNDELTKILGQCEGWCANDKAEALFNLIRDRDIRLSVEIGVLGGRSFFPQVLAHKYHTHGKAVGIDPFIGYPDWPQEKMDRLRQNILEIIKTSELLDYCDLITDYSDIVVPILPDDIGLLHVDGDHSFERCMQDVKLYLPKVKSGGIIWFDDACWETVIPAIEYAKQYCDVYNIFDRNNTLLMKR